MPMELLDKYFDLQREIYAFFDYFEDWRVIPIHDSTGFFWRIIGDGPGIVQYGMTVDVLDSDGDYYQDRIFTQRHLKKWVYQGNGFTMICCDTQTDGNVFLRVFDNEKEVA